MAKPITQRLFFALLPDDQVRVQIYQLQTALALSEGRLVHKTDLHITLQYLGQVADDQIDCVKLAASRVETGSFVLEIDNLHNRRRKLLWAGVTIIPDELGLLVHRLGEQLAVCGFAPEERAYLPHITLARRNRKAISSQLSDTICWEANDFVLMVSHTDGRIPRYEAVARFPLKLNSKALENQQRTY